MPPIVRNDQFASVIAAIEPVNIGIVGYDVAICVFMQFTTDQTFQMQNIACVARFQFDL